jgi:TolA-binding protein
VAFLRQLLLILFALVLGAGPLHASEQRDFAAAAAAFQDGMWNRAETGFAEFIKDHPTSARLPQATLMEAQADFKQGKFREAIALLQAGQPSAGSLADQYAYWIGNAQLLNGENEAAAETFARLSGTFAGSPWRLDGVVNEAAARAKLGQWYQVNQLLQNSEIFQNAARTNATDARVLNGRLLMAQTFLALNHPDSAIAILQSPGFQANPALDWQRLYLLCQAQLADGHTDEALALTTNLMDAASRANDHNLTAQSIAQQAGILETNGRLAEAIAVYRQNLTNNVPEDWQRQAIMKIAGLSAELKNFSDAENSLQKFQSRFTNSPAMDSVTLALGELHLKSYVTLHPITDNDLMQAQSSFNQFIDAFTNSPLLGRAYLDRGWCFWLEKNWSDASVDFQVATEKLPPSVDLAVAYFKLADAEFRELDLTNAYEHYRIVADDFTNFPAVNDTLGPEALYQMLRVSVQLRDLSAADSAVARILKIYPRSNAAETGILIDGVARSEFGQPEQARAQFQQFEQTFTNSEELPKVELEIARTYELEGDWPAAISIYDSWVGRFKDQSNLLPAVQYARALANFKGGRETNAFSSFTNFLAEYPSNVDLTPAAQWWLGDYYSGRGDWANAEENYELVFQNWPNSTLAYPAILMAGRAAVGRQGYENAKDYFTMIIGITNCPPLYANDPQDWYSLNAQAWFAYGDVLMQEPSTDTNNPLANYSKAITIFQEGVCQLYAGSQQAALAWGEIGDCYLQLASQDPQNYLNATNAYVQVMAAPAAEIAERSQAEVGIGLVLEKLAALTNGPAQTALLQSALNDYLDVFFGTNVREGEKPDPRWVKESGLQALRLMETLGVGDPNKFINQMEAQLPQLKDYLEKKRLELSRPKGGG